MVGWGVRELAGMMKDFGSIDRCRPRIYLHQMAAETTNEQLGSIFIHPPTRSTITYRAAQGHEQGPLGLGFDRVGARRRCCVRVVGYGSPAKQHDRRRQQQGQQQP